MTDIDGVQIQDDDSTVYCIISCGNDWALRELKGVYNDEKVATREFASSFASCVDLDEMPIVSITKGTEQAEEEDTVADTDDDDTSADFLMHTTDQTVTEGTSVAATDLQDDKEPVEYEATEESNSTNMTETPPQPDSKIQHSFQNFLAWAVVSAVAMLALVSIYFFQNLLPLVVAAPLAIVLTVAVIAAGKTWYDFRSA